MDKFQRLFGSNSTQALRNALCTFLCLNSFLRPVLLRPDYFQLHEMDKLRDLEVHGKQSGGRDGYEKKLQSEAKWLHDCTNVCGMRVFQMNHAVVWPSHPVLHELQMPHQNKRGLHRMWWNIERRFWPPFISSRWLMFRLRSFFARSTNAFKEHQLVLQKLRPLLYNVV